MHGSMNVKKISDILQKNNIVNKKKKIQLQSKRNVYVVFS